MSERALLQGAKAAAAAISRSPRMLQRQCACGAHTIGGATCEACRNGNRKNLEQGMRGLEREGVPSIVHEALRATGRPFDRVTRAFLESRMDATLDRASVRSDAIQPVQSGLSIGKATDQFEQEAERMSARVVAPQSAATGRNSGSNFANVRVHTGSLADASARAIGAKAYTVGNAIVFGAGMYAPHESEGRRLLAHELTHVIQQGASGAPAHGIVQRAIDPKIEKLLSYSPRDWMITDKDASDALDLLKTLSKNQQADFVAETKYLERLRDNLPSGRLIELKIIIADVASIKALEGQKSNLEAVTKAGSGKSFGEVGGGFAKLKDVSHDLSVLKTGTGLYAGDRSGVEPPPGVKKTNCTDIVLEVLEDTFAQQGRSADWIKVKRKFRENTKARGATKLSGLDVQAALQSECGWKGIYWAPDPAYQVPETQLTSARPDEASHTAWLASKGTYYKDFYLQTPAKKGYPGVSIDQSVTDYAPESPKPGYGDPSKTKKNTAQLDKLKKLPFGVLSAHGGNHMTIITYGKVIEVHWDIQADSVDVIERTDLEQWTVGKESGYHYYASGAIVAPASDVHTAFK